jgi:predicted DNA-binding transcriptional regulator YafY
MSRAARLLELMQALRRYRRPVTAAVLAGKLGVSQRTLYRDIATLIGQGAPIAGEAGTGYVLRDGFFLPPLAFDDDEIDAIVLGLRWVSRRADLVLAQAAYESLAKIAAVLPVEMREALESERIFAATDRVVPVATIDVHALREAIRLSRRVHIAYRDGKAAASARTIWPIALAFFNDVFLVVAWCEMRGDYRHFRADRIVKLAVSAERYPTARRALLKAWRAQNGHDLEFERY